jgi:hypothetical protein
MSNDNSVSIGLTALKIRAEAFMEMLESRAG